MGTTGSKCIDLDKAAVMMNRRMWAKENVRGCPSCGTEQIQLTSWVTNILKFKCRHCKFKWEEEMR